MKFRTGYDIGCDLHHGFTLKVGKLLIASHWDWPRIIWYNRSWAVNEHGYVQGMPIMRRKPKLWPIRKIYWERKFEVHWLNERYMAKHRLTPWQ